MSDMKVRVTLRGTRALLMHQDNVEWTEKTKAWQKNPENKKKSVAGDDRSPAWTWLGSLYHDGKVVTLPSDNIMTMLREGGTGVPVPGARGSKTFKAQTQSGLVPLDTDWPIYINGESIAVSELLMLEDVDDFDEHVSVVEDHGFSLFVKRAKIGQSKHIRVRPRFEHWVAMGRLAILDDQITPDVLQSILNIGGQLKGIGDWRPSSKTPGMHGTFMGEVEVI